MKMTYTDYKGNDPKEWKKVESKILRFRAGYKDGSGPEYIVAVLAGGEERAIAKTVWGCSCCEPSLEEQDTVFAKLIAKQLNHLPGRKKVSK